MKHSPNSEFEKLSSGELSSAWSFASEFLGNPGDPGTLLPGLIGDWIPELRGVIEMESMVFEVNELPEETFAVSQDSSEGVHDPNLNDSRTRSRGPFRNRPSFGVEWEYSRSELKRSTRRDHGVSWESNRPTRRGLYPENREFEFVFCGAQDAGLTFHRNRFYDPDLGRWGSRDPIGVNNRLAAVIPWFDDGLILARNWYGYVDSRPLAFFDPRGLDGEKVITWEGHVEVQAEKELPVKIKGMVHTDVWKDWKKYKWHVKFHCEDNNDALEPRFVENSKGWSTEDMKEEKKVKGGIDISDKLKFKIAYDAEVNAKTAIEAIHYSDSCKDYVVRLGIDMKEKLEAEFKIAGVGVSVGGG